MDDLISRQVAIEKTKTLYRDASDDASYMLISYNHALSDMRATLESLPSAERREVQSSGCEYWDSESNFCSLHRPSAEPRYCDRNICASNEVNGISCDECEVAKYYNLEDDDSICMDCGVEE